MISVMLTSDDISMMNKKYFRIRYFDQVAS